jgi:hypothetical protein
VVRFTPLDDNVASATFELNNALNISRVVDAQDKQIPASRNQQDSTVRLSFEQPLPKGQPVTIAFFYDGRLTGQEDSPVEGIKFAAIHPDFAYLMYPARWFPVSGYTTDRFAADVRVTVPAGYTVLGSGMDSRQAAGDKNVFEFKFEHPSFPGSIAVVKGDPVKVPSEGVTTSLYFRGPEADMAQAYGDLTGKAMSYFTGMFGLPPYANLTVVETEEGAPNGYAAPGPDLSGAARHRPAAQRQAGRQPGLAAVVGGAGFPLHAQSPVAHQRAGGLFRTAVDGARQRPGAMESQARDVMVEALTVDNVPIIQSARLEDYSPELWALTGSKGAAVLNMLRYVMGDDKFFQTLKAYASSSPGNRRTPTISARWRRTSRPEPGLLLHPVDRIEQRAGIQARVHHLPHPKGLPRDGQDRAGSGHVPHAGGSEDRDRRQSRAEARGSGGHFLRVLGGHLRQAQERGHRSPATACCATATKCAWRWPSAAANSSPS